MSKLIFVGGIHGVGKENICKRIISEIDICYLSASQLLRWYDRNCSWDKRVIDIKSNQEELLNALSIIRKKEDSYLLDGHFCLLDNHNEIRSIAITVFEQITPDLIIILTEKVEIIQQRLIDRDNVVYSLEFLRLFQNSELQRGKLIAENFNIDCCILEHSDDYHKAVDAISKLLKY